MINIIIFAALFLAPLAAAYVIWRKMNRRKPVQTITNVRWLSRVDVARRVT